MTKFTASDEAGDEEGDEEFRDDSDQPEPRQKVKKKTEFSKFAFTSKLNILVKELERIRDTEPKSKCKSSGDKRALLSHHSTRQKSRVFAVRKHTWLVAARVANTRVRFPDTERKHVDETAC